MTDPDLIRLFIQPLEALRLQYMITGGVAAVIYGDPRFTRDIDIVLDLSVVDAARLPSAFATGDYYVPPPETLEEEATRETGGHFNVIHGDTALRADIYVRGDDPFHHWAFGRRLRLSLDTMAIWVAPIEYVIIRKLDYYRMSGSDRHLRDVANMLRLSGDTVDFGQLNEWIRQFKLETQLHAARESGF